MELLYDSEQAAEGTWAGPSAAAAAVRVEKLRPWIAL